jgi:hypothetical protein
VRAALQKFVLDCADEADAIRVVETVFDKVNNVAPAAARSVVIPVYQFVNAYFAAAFEVSGCRAGGT